MKPRFMEATASSSSSSIIAVVSYKKSCFIEMAVVLLIPQKCLVREVALHKSFRS